MTLRWKEAVSSDLMRTYLAPVPGGLLIKIVTRSGVGMTYYPQEEIDRPLRWERVNEEHVPMDGLSGDIGKTFRAEVSGGCFIKSVSAAGVGLAFVPDSEK